jgi:hypothetical protein
MNQLGRLLRDSDPVAGESFPAVEIDRMLGRLRLEAERGVLQTCDDRVPSGAVWRVIAASLTCAAVVLVAVVAQRESPASRAVVGARGPEGVGVQRAGRSVVADARADLSAVAVAKVEAQAHVVPVRQLQFATPEGIRVFWTFDPDFQEN